MTRITLGYLAKYCIFVFLIIRIPKFSSANNYVFTVHTTKACPRNQSEMDERSLALNCTESNGYTCLPDKNLSVLLEFCYKRARIAVPKGYCLFLRNSDVDAYDCKLFMNGCPDADYYSDEIYKYPNCVAIGSGCFLVDASCYRIPAADTKTVTTNSKYFTKNTNLDYHLWISTLAVLIPICTVMCIVIIYIMHQQKKSQLEQCMMSPCEINTTERDNIAYSSDYSSKKENHSTDEISSIHTISDSSSFLNASSPLYDSFEQGPYSGVALSLDDNACLQQPDESERSLSGFSPLMIDD
uniref:Uncharacterized protein n=1 Tax=Magallana gigas TaxID=29159 RepID=A0A8W8M6C2_MAGGI